MKSIGYVDAFLSWNAFTVLGRLTYVVYLIHYNFLAIFYAHARKPYYYTVLDRVVFYLGVVFLSFLLSFFISIAIEIPLLNLEKIYIFNWSGSATVIPVAYVFTNIKIFIWLKLFIFIFKISHRNIYQKNLLH